MARYRISRGQMLPGGHLGAKGTPGQAYHYAIHDLADDTIVDIFASEAGMRLLSARLTLIGLVDGSDIEWLNQEPAPAAVTHE
jgi:hypothetical protein